MSSRDRLLGRIEALAAERDDLLSRLGRLDPVHIKTAPESGVWSAIQVVEHMIIAEEYCLLAHLPADQLQARSRPLLKRLVYELVVLLLKGPVRVSTPVKDMDPEGTAGLDELADRWRASHARLAEIVRTIDDPEGDAVFRHPVAGAMTPAQSIRMLEAHQRRHVEQIDERLAGSS